MVGRAYADIEYTGLSGRELLMHSVDSSAGRVLRTLRAPGGEHPTFRTSLSVSASSLAPELGDPNAY